MRTNLKANKFLKKIKMKKMKKLLSVCIALLLLSCGVDQSNFSGKWIDKKFESQVIEIAKDGENYLITLNDKKYPAQVKDGLLEISADSPYKANIDKDDILTISGDEFIRFEKAKKPKYLGKWDDEGFTLEISEKNNNIMNIKCIKGTWNKRDENAEFRYNNGQIEFYNPKADITNYFRITEDGRLEQTYNETQSRFLLKVE